MYNECRHIFTSGKKCQSPALKDQDFCYFHSNTRKRPAPKDEAYEPYIAPQDTAHNLPPARRRRRVPQVREANLGLQDAAIMVREIHEHEDGTLIGPAKQSPDPEEIEEQRRPPSLGEILLREAEAMKAQREAERQAEARQKAAAEAEDHPVSITISQIQAVAHMGAPQPALSLSKGLAEMCPQSAPRPNITDDSTLSRLHLLQTEASQHPKKDEFSQSIRGRWQPRHREQSFHLV
jgi:hypothetical protein